MTYEEMQLRVENDVSRWDWILINGMGFPEVPESIIVPAALAIQDKYFRTPNHSPDTLSESEVHYCVAKGLQALSNKYYSWPSPVDPPGMEGPMLFGEWMSSLIGHVFANRKFTGNAPEPRPYVPPTTGDGGPYPWSIGVGGR